MRLLPALALSAALLAGGCTYPDGRVNVPATLGLAAGAAIAGVAVGQALDDRPRYHRRPPAYYGPPRGYYAPPPPPPPVW